MDAVAVDELRSAVDDDVRAKAQRGRCRTGRERVDHHQFTCAWAISVVLAMSLTDSWGLRGLDIELRKCSGDHTSPLLEQVDSEAEFVMPFPS